MYLDMDEFISKVDKLMEDTSRRSKLEEFMKCTYPKFDMNELPNTWIYRELIMSYDNVLGVYAKTVNGPRYKLYNSKLLDELEEVADKAIPTYFRDTFTQELVYSVPVARLELTYKSYVLGKGEPFFALVYKATRKSGYQYDIVLISDPDYDSFYYKMQEIIDKVKED